ncbi:hypothetical protein [Thomasclavelia cocleata]|nr:hypothetical protein [Thomasclavelia cocleata]
MVVFVFLSVVFVVLTSILTKIKIDGLNSSLMIVLGTVALLKMTLLQYQ